MAGSVNDGNNGTNYAVTTVANTTGQITPRAIVVTAAAATKVYDGTTSSTTAPTITRPSVVSTLAGSAGQTGSSNGTGSAARFDYLSGVAVDSAGNVYVADTVNEEIRKITPAGVVTTLAGSARAGGSSDGTGSAARFYCPLAWRWTARATSTWPIPVMRDPQDHARRASSPPWLAPPGVGSSDGTGSAASFDEPTAWRWTARATSTWPTRTMMRSARSPPRASSPPWSAPRAERFQQWRRQRGKILFPQGVAVDSAGNVYVADTNNHDIRKITPSGVVSTLAGSAGQWGSSDGTGSAARFFWPSGVAVDSAGNVYVADDWNQEIREISPSGVVVTMAGSAGQTGSSNGTASAARFYYPYGVAVDSLGNVYVADRTNAEVRLVSGSTGVAAGDTAAFTETFDTRNVGTGKTLTAAGSVNDGNGGSNYAVTFVTTAAGQITARAITVTAAASTKVYDGTTSSTATPTVTAGSLATGDTPAFNETFDTKNVGSGKTLTAAGSVNDGNGDRNYAVTFAANTTGSVTVRAIAIAAVTATKVFDGTTFSTATPTITAAAWPPATRRPSPRPLTPRTLAAARRSPRAVRSTTATAAANYTVTTAAAITGQIVPLPITVAAATSSKGYDGTTSSTATPTVLSAPQSPPWLAPRGK